MNRDDNPDVTMVHLEEEKLFFPTHSKGGYGMTDVQMIHLTVKKLRARGPLYVRALSVWHGMDAEFFSHWENFCTTIDKQYVEMLS